MIPDQKFNKTKMKAILKSSVVFFLMVSAISVDAQTEELYQKKIDNFRPMKIIGISLMAASVPMGAIGLSLIADSNHTSDDLEGFLDSMTEYTTGYVLCVAAGASLIAGTVMTTISTIMIKKYQLKLNGLKVGAYFTPNQAGFTLTYRF
jgi:hypothetical protein